MREEEAVYLDAGERAGEGLGFHHRYGGLGVLLFPLLDSHDF